MWTDVVVATFGCFLGLTNTPASRAADEVWCAGSFLSVTIEDSAKRSANDRLARSTPWDKVRSKARHEEEPAVCH